MADYYTKEEIEKMYGDAPVAEIPAGAESPAKLEPAPGYYTRDDIEKHGRWSVEEPQERATESGYGTLLPAAAGRAIAGTVGGPIDLYNRGARFANEQFGSNLPVGKGSATSKLENILGVDRYKPTDSAEQAVYDAATAGLSVLAPYGTGLAARGIGAGVTALGLPTVGRGISGAGSFLTYGGPATQALAAGGGELAGEAAGEFASHFDPSLKEPGKMAGTLGGVLGIGGALSAGKYLGRRITEPFVSQERLAAQALNEKLGPGAAGTLAGTPGAGPAGPLEMTKTAAEVIPNNTGIASLDKFAREKSPEVYNAALENRNQARLGNVQIGTDVSGPVGDPAAELAAMRAGIATPSMKESILQGEAQATASGLPTRTGTEAEKSIGDTLNQRYNDALDAQIDKAAGVNKLVTGLGTRGRPGELILDFKNSVEAKDPITREGTGMLDEKAYQRWIDKNKDKLTDAQFDRLKNMRTAQEELKTFNAQTKDLAAQFPVTPGGSNAGLAEKYFGPGVDGTKGAAKYREVTGNDPAAMSDLFDYGVSKFRGSKDAFNADGTLNHTALADWMENHKGWLGEMPANLRDKLSNARDAQALFDQTATLRTTALKDFENSSAKHLLGPGDSMARMDNLVTKGDPVANIKEVMGQLRGSPAAQNGLKRNFIDWGGEKFFAKTDAAGVQTFNPDGFKQFFDKYGDTVKELYGKPGHDLLKKVYDDIGSQAAAEARAARATAGVPQNLQEGMVGKAVGKVGDFLNSTALGRGIKYLSIGHAIISGNPIGPVIATANAASTVNSMRRRGVDSVTDRIAELLNNPKAAALAMNKTPDEPNHPILKRLASTLTNASLGIGAEKATEKLEYGSIPNGVYPVPGEHRR